MTTAGTGGSCDGDMAVIPPNGVPILQDQNGRHLSYYSSIVGRYGFTKDTGQHNKQVTIAKSERRRFTPRGWAAERLPRFFVLSRWHRPFRCAIRQSRCPGM